MLHSQAARHIYIEPQVRREDYWRCGGYFITFSGVDFGFHSLLLFTPGRAIFLIRTGQWMVVYLNVQHLALIHLRSLSCFLLINYLQRLVAR